MRQHVVGSRTVNAMLSTVAAYVHDLDPFALRLWGNVGIRWYGLSYLVGFLIAYWLIRRVVAVGVSSLTKPRAADLIVALAIGTVLGGRLGYVLFYKPSMFWQFSASFPFWDLLAINKGGMASHGGMAGAILGCIYYARRGRHRVAHILDLAAFATPVGLCIGRFANFVNGELYGRTCDPDLPWAVKFPQEMFHWLPGESDRMNALQEAVDLIAADGAGARLNLQAWVGQAIEAIQQGNQQVVLILAPHLTARHPSQIYQALLEGLAVFVVLATLWWHPRRPGVVGGAFLASYAMMRCVGELFRQPDEHIQHMEAQMLNLSRGQLLSLPVLVAGVWMMWHFGRKPTEPMGGLVRGSDEATPMKSGQAPRRSDEGGAA